MSPNLCTKSRASKVLRGSARISPQTHMFHTPRCLSSSGNHPLCHILPYCLPRFSLPRPIVSRTAVRAEAEFIAEFEALEKELIAKIQEDGKWFKDNKSTPMEELVKQCESKYGVKIEGPKIDEWRAMLEKKAAKEAAKSA